MIEETFTNHAGRVHDATNDEETSYTSEDVANNVIADAVSFSQIKDAPVIIAMGENHEVFSHQISQALTLKKLDEKNETVTLFMELPHNRLENILVDRGYSEHDAHNLAQYISEQDPKGHITAKAIIGGNELSLGGDVFPGIESQMVLQTALQHNINIVYADAARVYPDDFCMDYNDPSTLNAALSVDANQAPYGQMGSDDMLIRNTHMADRITNVLRQNSGIGVLATGAAHCFGSDDEENGHHTYADSLSQRFEERGLSSVMLTMVSDHQLPDDYAHSSDHQKHVYYPPSPQTRIQDLQPQAICEMLRDNGLDPDHYDPTHNTNNYRAEFDSILTQARSALGIALPEPIETGWSKEI